MLTGQKALAEFFEQMVTLGAPPKAAANWVLGSVLRQLSVRNMEAEGIPMQPAALAKLIALVEQGRVNRNTAVQVFEAAFDGGDPEQYIQAHALEQVSDVEQVSRMVEQVLDENPGSVADYRAGKEKSFGFLVGQTMRKLGGKADPKLVNDLLRKQLLMQ